MSGLREADGRIVHVARAACRTLAEPDSPDQQWKIDIDEIVTERSGSILRVQLTARQSETADDVGMYRILADVFNGAAKDERTRVVLWHGAGDSFCAGNDVEDFLKNPPGPGESPQAALMNALVDFDKPLVAAVQGNAVGGGTTMLLHCDFVYAAENAKFQMPFINLALVPEFGSSWAVPARIGPVRAAELIFLDRLSTQTRRGFGFVTQVVPDQSLLATRDRDGAQTGSEAGRRAAGQQRLLKRSFREQLKAAMTAENAEFSAQVHSADAKEALTAFLEKRAPNFSRTKTSATSAAL